MAEHDSTSSAAPPTSVKEIGRDGHAYLVLARERSDPRNESRCPMGGRAREAAQSDLLASQTRPGR